MGYRVEFEFSPLYELVTSLDLFLSKKSLKNVELGPDWLKAVQSKLDQQNIKLQKPKELPCFDYLYLLIWQSPEKENVDEFLKWLGALEPGSIYEKLFSYVSEALPPNLTEIRDKYIELIKHWNDVYFRDLEEEIIGSLREEVITLEGLLPIEDSEQFVEKVTGGLKLKAYVGLQQVILTPTYHLNPLMAIRKYKNIVHVLYPIDLPELNSNVPSKKLVRLTKALADENRLKIIKLVADNPKTFTELLHHFDISKSTVHHHVMLLRAAGLISTYHTDQFCHETFVYRPDGLPELSSLFLKYIGGAND